jgi:hypothetical protein
MLLEDILLAVAVGAALLVVGWPIYRFLKVTPWRRKDPLAQAQERLRRPRGSTARPIRSTSICTRTF